MFLSVTKIIIKQFKAKTCFCFFCLNLQQDGSTLLTCKKELIRFFLYFVIIAILIILRYTYVDEIFIKFLLLFIIKRLQRYIFIFNKIFISISIWIYFIVFQTNDNIKNKFYLLRLFLLRWLYNYSYYLNLNFFTKYLLFVHKVSKTSHLKAIWIKLIQSIICLFLVLYLCIGLSIYRIYLENYKKFVPQFI